MIERREEDFSLDSFDVNFDDYDAGTAETTGVQEIEPVPESGVQAVEECRAGLRLVSTQEVQEEPASLQEQVARVRQSEARVLAVGSELPRVTSRRRAPVRLSRYNFFEGGTIDTEGTRVA